MTYKEWLGLNKGDLILSSAGSIREVIHNDKWGNVCLSKKTNYGSRLKTVLIGKERKGNYTLYGKRILGSGKIQLTKDTILRIQNTKR